MKAFTTVFNALVSNVPHMASIYNDVAEFIITLLLNRVGVHLYVHHCVNHGQTVIQINIIFWQIMICTM